VCLDVADTVLLTALCRALVETAVDQWRRAEPAPEVPVTMLRLATWRAARYGVESDLVDPRTMQLAPARDVVPALVTHVATALDACGDRAVVEAGLERLWAQGNGADRQRRTMERTGQLVDVVAQAVRLTAGKDSD
jgi:carboxylate-amine ligase